jgi:hypothetical protein
MDIFVTEHGTEDHVFGANSMYIGRVGTSSHGNLRIKLSEERILAGIKLQILSNT